jgi:hypothetical protein
MGLIIKNIHTITIENNEKLQAFMHFTADSLDLCGMQQR